MNSGSKRRCWLWKELLYLNMLISTNYLYLYKDEIFDLQSPISIVVHPPMCFNFKPLNNPLILSIDWSNERINDLQQRFWYMEQWNSSVYFGPYLLHFWSLSSSSSQDRWRRKMWDLWEIFYLFRLWLLRMHLQGVWWGC